MRVAAYTVGIDSRVEELMKLLDVKSSGVRVLGLHGMGGVGKTTLAKAVYNKLVGKFECRSFITNVREISRQNDGLISHQHNLIDDLSLDNTVLTRNEIEANISAIKEVADKRKVTVVLDDVDDIGQLNALLGKKERMEMKRDDAIYILKGCGFRAELAITVLTAKSLIKIIEDDTLWMHDQFRDMGRQIVRQENLQDPRNRSRL
ncbi:hypothetical protein Q3G72_022693 [Acer saccharum]|nr:hypothetical protein Q3G72_022693 [Acer saccharum]